MRLIFSIAVFTLFCSVSYGALSRSRDCARGPQFWCSSLDNMRECGATGYCAQLWRRSAAESAADSVDASPEDCGFCKLLVADLEKMVVANKTEAEIRASAERACALVPQPRLSALCRSVIDRYLPQVLQLLLERLPPARICRAVGLCGPQRRGRLTTTTTTTTTTKLPKLPKLPGNGSALCDDCVKVLASVKQAVEDNKTLAELEQMLKQQLCSQLGPLQQACDSLVDQYLPEVLQLLDKDIQPQQLCTLLGFCSSAKLAKYKTHPVLQLMLLQKSARKPLGSVECEACEALVNEARQLIRQKKTQAEIIDFVVKRVCALVPAEKEQCTAAVQEYGPILFALLSSELDPQTVCQALGACGRTLGQSRRLPTARAGPQCIACEFVVRELDRLLGSNRSVAAVESALDKVCSVLPATVRRECDQFVGTYTPVVVQLLTNELSPGLLCTVLGLCAGTRQQLQSPVNSATVCDVCQTVIGYAKSLLMENATEAEVTQVIERVCSFLPTAEQAACRSFVEQYGPYVIQLLLQDVHPRQICQTLGLCKSGKRQQSARFAANGMVHMSRD